MRAAEKSPLTYRLEEEAMQAGYAVIAGTDEAGRGPLAGPVYAAAVILAPGTSIPGLNDSKKLTEKSREAFFEVITGVAVSYAVASASVEEIEMLNILNAAQLAMRRAVAALSPCPSLVLVDGNIARDFPVPTRTVIHGDALSPSIAAASILAKVSRDRVCLELDALYPQYGFARHKGYGTKEHYRALAEYGPSPAHRMSFLKKMPKES